MSFSQYITIEAAMQLMCQQLWSSCVLSLHSHPCTARVYSLKCETTHGSPRGQFACVSALRNTMDTMHTRFRPARWKVGAKLYLSTAVFHGLRSIFLEAIRRVATGTCVGKYLLIVTTRGRNVDEEWWTLRPRKMIYFCLHCPRRKTKTENYGHNKDA